MCPSGAVRSCGRHLVNVCPHAESQGERRLCRLPGPHLRWRGPRRAQPGAQCHREAQPGNHEVDTCQTHEEQEGQCESQWLRKAKLSEL